jgi:hypothetical protein
MEGSLVAVPADREAIIGRVEASEGPVREFWRAMAEALPEPAPVEPPATAVKPPDRDSLKAAFAAQIRELREQHGIAVDELATILNSELSASAPTLEQALGTISALEARLAALEQDRVSPGVPVPPLRSVSQIFDQLETLLDQKSERALAATRALVDSRVGRVHPAHSYRQAIHAETETMLREERERRESARKTPRDLVASAIAEGLDSVLQGVDPKALVEKVRAEKARRDAMPENIEKLVAKVEELVASRAESRVKE